MSEKDMLDKLGESVERSLDEINSKQNRFDGDVDSFFGSLFRLYQHHEQAPKRATNNKARDAWLASHWHLEPHWAGMLRNEAALNANRGWSLVGGRLSVNRAKRVLQQNYVAADLYGHRPGLASTSMAYHTQDIGAVVETARVDLGSNEVVGPLQAFLQVDPSRCRLTGRLDTPLLYHEQEWGMEDYWRFPSMVSTNEQMLGLGLCSTSVLLEMLTILMAVYRHDQEQLGAKAPQGLLLLSGISAATWQGAMESRSAELEGMGRRVYGGVSVLASQNSTADAKLLSLSQLPVGFDKKMVVELLIYLMSMVLGRDPAEYWPISGGTFGRSEETKVQSQKATTKADAELLFAYQEKLNDETYGLPRSVSFGFEERDDQGKLLRATVANEWAKFATALWQGGVGPLVEDRGKILSHLVTEGVLPPEFTEAEEEAEATDVSVARTKLLRERAMNTPRIAQYISWLSDVGQSDVVVRYDWPNTRPETPLFLIDGGEIKDPYTHERIYGRSIVMPDVPWKKSVVWDGLTSLPLVTRAGAILYENDELDFLIDEDDIEIAIEEAGERLGDEFEMLLTAPEYEGDDDNA